ncbi:MAG: hypothetical protein LBT47_10760 [Deltaproteobacteria bacterium]|jgi:hypothetical protein|nr:hypothetical protein [Deltaproteobacteria bacterium]
MFFPLILTVGSILDQAGFGPTNQGADYLGAADLNVNQHWSLLELNHGQEYEFIITPSGINGNHHFVANQHFEVTVELFGAKNNVIFLHIFSVLNGKILPLSIRFQA